MAGAELVPASFALAVVDAARDSDAAFRVDSEEGELARGGEGRALEARGAEPGPGSDKGASMSLQLVSL